MGCLSLLAVVTFVGCKSLKGVQIGSPAGPYVVKVKQTAFYRYGPAQATGPDFNLNQGQPVTVLRRDFGFSRVTLEGGQVGFVANDDLMPAPPGTSRGSSVGGSRRPGPSLSRSSNSGGPSSANQAIMQNAPLFEAGDLPPLPTNPEPSHEEAPKFRANTQIPDRTE